ncbi:MAG: diaminobutyrate acetyltransferase [Alphaproteobacteria bacterium]|nr:diaminobutyrate acetyltransferase [Alphaproteobacteria bacterium]
MRRPIELRPPQVEDAEHVWALVRDTGVLDLNSSYLYLLLCAHHASTCAVALEGDALVGFVSGYRLPDHPDTWFLWQVGVAEAARGRGLATRLVHEVLDRPAHADVRWLHTTVAPSNTASRALFDGVARALETDLRVEDGFGPHLFPDAHEAEELLVLGPFDRST